MKKNSELPKIRIETELKEQIDKTLTALNKNSEGVEISLAQFRRMAYKFFIQDILKNGLTLDFRMGYK